MHSIEPEVLKTSSSAVREPANDISQNVIAASQDQAEASIAEGMINRRLSWLASDFL
jgi:hypothetical protein